MEKKNIVKEKSFDFAVEVVRLVKTIKNDKKEFDMTRQLVRSGTAVGALIYESEYAQSKKDFLNKLNIALKEACETEYWLRLLHTTEYLSSVIFEKMIHQIIELIKILVAITKTLKTQVR